MTLEEMRIEDKFYTRMVEELTHLYLLTEREYKRLYRYLERTSRDEVRNLICKILESRDEQEKIRLEKKLMKILQFMIKTYYR